MRGSGEWSRDQLGALTGDRPVLCSCAVRVSRPFEIVKRQLLEVDAGWMADAYRAGAIAGGFASGGHRADQPSGSAGEIRVRVERRYVGRSVFALPLRWEGIGRGLPAVMTGALGVFGVGPAEVEIGLISLSPRPERAEGLWEYTRLERVMDTAMRSFLACVVQALAPGRGDRRDGGRGNAVSVLPATRAGPLGGRRKR